MMYGIHGKYGNKEEKIRKKLIFSILDATEERVDFELVNWDA
jgi:hypothetical protein